MADLDLIGRTLGGFILREWLGAGSYGAVYRAEHELIERQVVVKVLIYRRSKDATARRRFMREAKLLSLMDHDYAVHVYAFGEEPGVSDDWSVLWIAMERVEGVTLEERLRTQGGSHPTSSWNTSKRSLRYSTTRTSAGSCTGISSQTT
jgi:serine/threonine protein kinase